MAVRMGRADSGKINKSVTAGRRKKRKSIPSEMEQLLVAEARPPKNSLVKVVGRKNYRVYIGVALVTIAVVTTYVITSRKQAVNPASIYEIPQRDLEIAQKENARDIVYEYSAEYHTVDKELHDLSFTEWDKEVLDKAYFSLLYTDKIGAFMQAHAVLALIEAAQKSGVDIDENSFGIDHNMRNEVRKRADNRAQAVLDRYGGESDE